MKKRIPTDKDYQFYDGAHCPLLWNQLDDAWQCPGCGRTKRQIMRWTFRTPYGRRFWGWLAGLCEHHDHSSQEYGQGRFLPMIICNQCNNCEGYVKHRLKLPDNFSFAPEEIREFISATPHDKHKINLSKAKAIYERLI